MEARAVGSVPVQSSDGKATQNTQANELLHSLTLDDNEEPTICAVELQSESMLAPVRYLYVLWKVSMPIGIVLPHSKNILAYKCSSGRPKQKIQKMGVYFATSASLKSSEKTLLKPPSDEYLPGMVSISMNLLEPFVNDPALSKTKLYLSASRITQTPTTMPMPRVIAKPLKTGPRRFFRAAPALLLRVRFLPRKTVSEPDAVIASLDFETTDFAASDLSLDIVKLKLSAGTAESLCKQLPLHCRPNDQVTLLFKLLPPSNEIADTSSMKYEHELSIDAMATVFLSESCKSKVRIMWKTAVDFDSFKTNSRPPSLIHSGSRPISNRLSGKDLPKLPGPDSLPITDQQHDARAITTSAAGIHLTISGPHTVYVGETFHWKLLVVNRSDQLQRLAVLVIPKRRRTDLTKSGTVPKNVAKKIQDNSVVTQLVLEDRLVLALQRMGMQDTTELVCLSPDIRIGYVHDKVHFLKPLLITFENRPLSVSACFETEIKFLPLATGVLLMDSLRLIDLNTQEAIDVKYLPDIVSVERI